MKAGTSYPEGGITLHTLYDLIDTLATAMQAGFARIEERFERMEERFEGVDRRFEQMGKRFDDMDAWFDRLEYELHDTQRRQSKLEMRDEDRADTMLNHEERIGTLELWCKGMRYTS